MRILARHSDLSPRLRAIGGACEAPRARSSSSTLFLALFFPRTFQAAERVIGTARRRYLQTRPKRADPSSSALSIATSIAINPTRSSRFSSRSVSARVRLATAEREFLSWPGTAVTRADHEEHHGSPESRLKQRRCSETETGRRGEPRRTREACAHEPPRVLSPSRNVILPLARRVSPSSSLASSRRCPLSVPIGTCAFVHIRSFHSFARTYVRLYAAHDVLFPRDLQHGRPNSRPFPRADYRGFCKDSRGPGNRPDLDVLTGYTDTRRDPTRAVNAIIEGEN